MLFHMVLRFYHRYLLQICLRILHLLYYYRGLKTSVMHKNI
nr:MAG TPA: hypothetical protein [Caudoviricetes sp.]